MKNFWSYSKEDIFKKLDTSENGLSSEEAANKIEKYGKNILGEEKSSSKFMVFLSQFKSPITLILIFAAILSIFTKDYSDGFIILIIIMISSLLSYMNESHALDAVKKLLSSVSVKSTVLRDGKFQEIDNSMLVLGDIIKVSTGDMIRLIVLLLKQILLQLTNQA